MTEKEFKDFIIDIQIRLNDNLFAKLYKMLSDNPGKREVLNPAFPHPQKVRIGLLKNCLAIEYVGPVLNDEETFNTDGTYKPNWTVYDFLGLDITHLQAPVFEGNSNLDNVSMFIGNSLNLLTNYFYDLTQGPSELLLMGSMMGFANPKAPIHISNSNIYWTDSDDNLKVKRIDYLDIVPFDTDSEVVFYDDESLSKIAEYLFEVGIPKYNIDLHFKLNGFIELINTKDITEPQITSYLSENPEILQLAFGVHNLNSQIDLIWQYDANYSNLKPDFLPVRMDGFSDILEFKLPWLKNRPMVGRNERNHPSFEIDSAIAQIDLYERWCAQDVNTIWLEKEKGIKLNKPDRILVIGHTDEYPSEERARLRAIRNTKVYTYDEFIEMARVQLYRSK